MTRLNLDPLHEGDEVAAFDFAGRPADPAFDPHPALQLHVMDAPSVFEQHSVAELLEHLRFGVTNAVRELEPFA